MVFSLRFVGGCISVAACSVALAASGSFAQTAKPGSSATPVQQALLPARFSGWMEAEALKTGTTAAGLDAADADVLDEYGLKDFAENTYRRGGSRVNLRAMRFADATGAYGAFTFYRKPGMKPETLGNGGAGDANEVVFWSGVTVVDATFDSAAENPASALKSLVAQLPQAAGSNAVAPTLPQYLPQSGLDPSTIHYATGPVAYTRMGGVLPVALIDFSRDAEAVTAQYSHQSGKGTLTILEYPTPQMAMDRAKAIDAMLKGPLPATLQQGNQGALAVKHSGPLVAVTNGDMSAEEAQALLAGVKYQADVTWNRPDNFKREVKNAAAMLIGIAYLTAILAACAVSLGFFLGGGRALWRIMRGKPASAVYEEEFISLDLKEWRSGEARKLP
jgi:hypothetical protein